MKTMFDIRQLAERVHEIQQQKEDFISNTRQLALYDGGAEGLKISMKTAEGERQFGINDHAHGQISGRLDIPRKYYNRLKDTSPALLSANVNHWFAREPENRMVRTIGGVARAFLSDRYMRVENEQIAEVALPILAEIPDVRFESCAITETNMYIKAVAPRLQGEVRVGDIVQAGVSLRNSEVGAGAVVIQPFVYRLVCKNGAMVNDSRFRANHVGARITTDEQFAGMLSDEAIAADDHALLLRFRDVLRGMLTQEFFDACVGKMRDATEDRMTGDIPATVNAYAKSVSLSQNEESGVLRHLIEGGDLSRYGLMNAVTRFSQDVEKYDRAHELEVIGGAVIDLPRSKWRELVAA